MRAAARHMLKPRRDQGTLQKARRGVRRFALPLGYGHHASGAVVYAPDAQGQPVVRLLLRQFEALGTWHARLR
jgi:hypothetical protein